MNPSAVQGAALPGERAAVSTLTRVAVLMAVVLLPRLLVFGVNENLYGDAVVRAELGGRWAAHPHPIGSYDQGVFQFGPLHVLLLGVLTWLGGSLENIGRWLSLVAGTLTVIPLFTLTRRLFGQTAAIVACLGLAACGMHVQCSTTAASEALALLLIVATAALFARAVGEGHRPSLLGAALCLNLGCATRYDAWLWVPLLSATLATMGRWRWAVLFAVLCLAFPLAWAYGNWGDRGEPFFPFRMIDEYHRRWFPDGERLWGATRYRLQNLVFWPATAIATLSPLLGIAGLWGLVRAYRQRKDARWVVALVVIPTALFTFRSTVTGSFVPLARFTIKEVALVLPFIWFGFEAIPVGKLRAWVVGFAGVVAVAAPIALGLFTLHREGKWEDTLRPISPVSTNPVELMRVARFLEREVNRRGEAAILDNDGMYRDLQVAFFSGLPEERLARHRWEIFPLRVAAAQPKYLVRIEGGTLERVASVDGRTLRFNEWTFNELDGFQPPFHVYKRF